jgi:hypothetical protein
MVDKTKYVNRFKDLYRQKNDVELSDSLALEYFEKLVTLVDAVYKTIPLGSQENE